MELQDQINRPELPASTSHDEVGRGGPPHKNWLSRHMLLGNLFLIAVFALAVALVYSWQVPDSFNNNFPQPPPDKADKKANCEKLSSDLCDLAEKNPNSTKQVQVIIILEKDSSFEFTSEYGKVELKRDDMIQAQVFIGKLIELSKKPGVGFVRKPMPIVPAQ